MEQEFISWGQFVCSLFNSKVSELGYTASSWQLIPKKRQEQRSKVMVIYGLRLPYKMWALSYSNFTFWGNL
jgi:hypothetical protein